MSFDAKAFMDSAMGTYTTVSKVRNAREEKAYDQASLILAGAPDYEELAKDRELMATQAAALVQELELSDGTNAALNKVFKMLELQQNSDDRVEAVRKQLIDSATKTVHPSNISSTLGQQTEDAFGADSEEPLAGVKVKGNETDPQNEKREKGALGDVVVVGENKKRNPISKLFDVKGRIKDRAYQIAAASMGGEDVLSGYLNWRQTGQFPTLEGIDPTMEFEVVYKNALRMSDEALADATEVQLATMLSLLSEDTSPEGMERYKLASAEVEKITEARNIAADVNGTNPAATAERGYRRAAYEAGILKEDLYSYRDGKSVKDFLNFKKEFNDTFVGQLLTGNESYSKVESKKALLDEARFTGEVDETTYARLKKELDTLSELLREREDEKTNSQSTDKYVALDVYNQNGELIGNISRNHRTGGYSKGVGKGPIADNAICEKENHFCVPQGQGKDLVTAMGPRLKDLSSERSATKNVMGLADSLFDTLERADRAGIEMNTLTISGAKAAFDVTTEIKNLVSFFSGSTEGLPTATVKFKEGTLDKIYADNDARLKTVSTIKDPKLRETARLQAEFLNTRVLLVYEMGKAYGQTGLGMSNRDYIEFSKAVFSAKNNDDLRQAVARSVLGRVDFVNDNAYNLAQEYRTGYNINLIENHAVGSDDYMRGSARNKENHDRIIQRLQTAKDGPQEARIDMPTLELSGKIYTASQINAMTDQEYLSLPEEDKQKVIAFNAEARGVGL